MLQLVMKVIFHMRAEFNGIVNAVLLQGAVQAVIPCGQNYFVCKYKTIGLCDSKDDLSRSILSNRVYNTYSGSGLTVNITLTPNSTNPMKVLRLCS